MKIGIVTATTDIVRAQPCILSWASTSMTDPSLLVVENGSGGEYLGTVPAFSRGVRELLAEDPAIDVVACLHDDLRIDQLGWDAEVLRIFEHHPSVGLVGFGGAIGLGTDTLYREPYDPMQLARLGFRSNLEEAESHGARIVLPERVACLDGFSLIGRRDFFKGHTAAGQFLHEPPWQYLERNGFVHHFYDGALGCLARRLGWWVYVVPVRCHHYGGRTAVGDPGYQQWASAQIDGGDRGFWQTAHRLGYDLFQDVLPIRL